MCSEITHNIYCSSIETDNKNIFFLKNSIFFFKSILAKKEASSEISPGLPFHTIVEYYRSTEEKHKDNKYQ